MAEWRGEPGKPSGGSGRRLTDPDAFFADVVAVARTTTLYGVGFFELYYRTPFAEYERLAAAANDNERQMSQEV